MDNTLSPIVSTINEPQITELQNEAPKEPSLKLSYSSLPDQAVILALLDAKFNIFHLPGHPLMQKTKPHLYKVLQPYNKSSIEPYLKWRNLNYTISKDISKLYDLIYISAFSAINDWFIIKNVEFKEDSKLILYLDETKNSVELAALLYYIANEIYSINIEQLTYIVIKKFNLEKVQKVQEMLTNTDNYTSLTFQGDKEALFNTLTVNKVVLSKDVYRNLFLPLPVVIDQKTLKPCSRPSTIVRTPIKTQTKLNRRLSNSGSLNDSLKQAYISINFIPYMSADQFAGILLRKSIIPALKEVMDARTLGKYLLSQRLISRTPIDDLISLYTNDLETVLTKDKMDAVLQYTSNEITVSDFMPKISIIDQFSVIGGHGWDLFSIPFSLMNRALDISTEKGSNQKRDVYALLQIYTPIYDSGILYFLPKTVITFLDSLYSGIIELLVPPLQSTTSTYYSYFDTIDSRFRSSGNPLSSQNRRNILNKNQNYILIVPASLTYAAALHGLLAQITKSSKDIVVFTFIIGKDVMNFQKLGEVVLTLKPASYNLNEVLSNVELTLIAVSSVGAKPLNSSLNALKDVLMIKESVSDNQMLEKVRSLSDKTFYKDLLTLIYLETPAAEKELLVSSLYFYSHEELLALSFKHYKNLVDDIDWDNMDKTTLTVTSVLLLTRKVINILQNASKEFYKLWTTKLSIKTDILESLYTPMAYDAIKLYIDSNINAVVVDFISTFTV